eukprot:1188006-Prorocentrum_minimum.AAC.1
MDAHTATWPNALTSSLPLPLARTSGSKDEKGTAGMGWIQGNKPACFRSPRWVPLHERSHSGERKISTRAAEYATVREASRTLATRVGERSDANRDTLTACRKSFRRAEVSSCGRRLSDVVAFTGLASHTMGHSTSRRISLPCVRIPSLPRRYPQPDYRDAELFHTWRKGSVAPTQEFSKILSSPPPKPKSRTTMLDIVRVVPFPSEPRSRLDSLASSADRSPRPSDYEPEPSYSPSRRRHRVTESDAALRSPRLLHSQGVVRFAQSAGNPRAVELEMVPPLDRLILPSRGGSRSRSRGGLGSRARSRERTPRTPAEDVVVAVRPATRNNGRDRFTLHATYTPQAASVESAVLLCMLRRVARASTVVNRALRRSPIVLRTGSLIRFTSRPTHGCGRLSTWGFEGSPGSRGGDGAG